MSDHILGSKKKKIATNAERPDLSDKLERLKRGLVADTIRVTSKPYPSLRDSKINYGLKSGRLGAFDPLRQRSKMFRKAVTTFAPPYYFWHKEFINRMKLKPLVDANQLKVELPEDLTAKAVSCIWCSQKVETVEYETHKTKRCKRRHEFLGNGYYRCSSCKEGFLDEKEAKQHISLHFPNQEFIDEEQGSDGSQMTANKNLPIICRDQAKRKKWL